jgi:hypothetical protein
MTTGSQVAESWPDESREAAPSTSWSGINADSGSASLRPALAGFDGSAMVDRTAGEVSARCHDEQANFLALNLMHDIVTGAKNVQEARQYYAKEFADYRRKNPTPYMEKLRFTPADQNAADPDVRLLSEEDLEAAKRAGESRGEGGSHG